MRGATHLLVELGVEKRSMAGPEETGAPAPEPGDVSAADGFLWSSFRRCSSHKNKQTSRRYHDNHIIV